jgi:hypothetical protein
VNFLSGFVKVPILKISALIGHNAEQFFYCELSVLWNVFGAFKSVPCWFCAIPILYSRKSRFSWVILVLPVSYSMRWLSQPETFSSLTGSTPNEFSRTFSQCSIIDGFFHGYNQLFYGYNYAVLASAERISLLTESNAETISSMTESTQKRCFIADWVNAETNSSHCMQPVSRSSLG